MPDYSENWKLDSGLRENMDLTIHAAYFAPHAEYQGGRVLLLFLIGEDENGDPQELRMSIGSDWTTADGGRTVTHPTKKFINKSTIYGHWINHALEVPGLKERLIAHPTPTDASVWENMILRLNLTPIHFGKNLDDQERLMPTEFLGIYGGAGGVPPAVATPAPSATLPITETPTSNGSPLYDQVVGLAKSLPDFPTFLAAALALPGVISDEELTKQIADESVIWAASR